MNKQSFLKHWQAGHLCLHPTDTIPGISFDPENPIAVALFYKTKQRDSNKPMISLAADLPKALTFWKPLPGRWEETLDKLWPGPLSVIWEARQNHPQALIFQGTIALRAPLLAPKHQWFTEVLEEARLPIPSSSVNPSGLKPILDLEIAKDFLKNGRASSGYETALPSTIIRLTAWGFEVVRQGAMPLEHIQRTAL
jgi:L-threonylcarbamoyladenylate synthase